MRWTGYFRPRITPSLQAVVGMTDNDQRCFLFNVEFCSDQLSGRNAMAQLGAGLSFFVRDRGSLIAQVDVRRTFARSTDAVRLVLGARLALR